MSPWAHSIEVGALRRGKPLGTMASTVRIVQLPAAFDVYVSRNRPEREWTISASATHARIH